MSREVLRTTDLTRDAAAFILRKARRALAERYGGGKAMAARTIARELRKYNVTLLIVDQRPSGIDEEVMSQVGTRVTALLNGMKGSAWFTWMPKRAHSCERRMSCGRLPK